MVGEIVHIELPSADFVRSASFYAKLFGWKTDGVQSGGHLLFELPGGVQGSWIREALAQAAGPVPFVAVADVDKSLAEAERQGGRILVRRMTLANRGVFGLLADCDGNVIGVLSAKSASVAGISTVAPTSKKDGAGPIPGATRKDDANSKAAKETATGMVGKPGTTTGTTTAKTTAKKSGPPAAGRKR
jgi:predicted enzyme related to lactoylglutathione lyase